MEGPALARSAASPYGAGPRVWQRRRRRAELQRTRHEQGCVSSGLSSWTYLAHCLAGEAVPYTWAPSHPPPTTLPPSATHPKDRFKGNTRIRCEDESGFG